MSTSDRGIPDVEDPSVGRFVRDEFFEPGHVWLKVRQVLVALFFWLVLLGPIAVLVNDTSRVAAGGILDRLTSAEGHELARNLVVAISVIAAIVLVCSVCLLIRNNHRERQIYPTLTTYDADGLAKRTKIIEAMYTERFGSATMRHGTRYYVVAPEQNLENGSITDLFHQEHTDVGEAVR